MGREAPITLGQSQRQSLLVGIYEPTFLRKYGPLSEASAYASAIILVWVETWEEKSSKMRTEPSAEVSGSAVAQGELGDTRARDWAEVQESMARPFYEAVLGKTAIRPIVLEGSAVNGPEL